MSTMFGPALSLLLAAFFGGFASGFARCRFSLSAFKPAAISAGTLVADQRRIRVDRAGGPLGRAARTVFAQLFVGRLGKGGELFDDFRIGGGNVGGFALVRSKAIEDWFFQISECFICTMKFFSQALNQFRQGSTAMLFDSEGSFSRSNNRSIFAGTEGSALPVSGSRVRSRLRRCILYLPLR